MKFCAQGYADLTRLLKPDIAVLEGGYAIEGALPYVNLGIILALAGLDYSRVVEPNYNPDKLKQAPHVTEKIKKTVEIINTHWANRHAMREKVGKPGEIQERLRDVYYDTDNILERQKEKIRICRDCGGAFQVESTAMPGFRVLTVHIPQNACPQCREKGYEMYDRAQKNKYDKIILQDKPRDIYTISPGT